MPHVHLIALPDMIALPDKTVLPDKGHTSMNSAAKTGVPALRPRRTITGMSAILLPVFANGEIEWDAFRAHVLRTADAGLVPAVNMDTGYGHLLSESQRVAVLEQTRDVLSGGKFVAGAFVKDQPEARFQFDAYRRQFEQIVSYGGTPIVFQSYGLTQQSNDDIVASYQRLGEEVREFLGFELGTMFAPFGKIYDLPVFEGLLSVKTCTGAKHSSLSRVLEWQRLEIRDRVRPDFKVLTGNDLAIDMVIYGSDYLLGLSTFAPEEFALRDRCWAQGDAGFYELNDLLQYLGFFAFRNPVPAYKHSAAQFLHLREWISTSLTFPGSPERSPADVDVLHDIYARLQNFTKGA